MRAALLVLLAPLAGCLAPAAPEVPGTDPPAVVPDATAQGLLKVVLAPYDFGLMLVTDEYSRVTYPSVVRGNVHYPADGSGPYPLVLLLHGRHGTCRLFLLGQLPEACRAPASENVESYKGYDYLAKGLASHGYVVASLDANSINGRDHYFGSSPVGHLGDAGAHERAQLVLQTLDEFARLHRKSGGGLGEALKGRLDLDRIGLMGHSRGGDGIVRAHRLNAERPAPYGIRALFALAPTDFFRQPVTDVAFATMLPYCDGDVSTLHGSWMFDDARYLAEKRPGPKVQLTAMGANHNWYNRVWTGDGDDAGIRFNDDPYCRAKGTGRELGAGRLTSELQERQGHAYITGWFRHTLGDEADLLAYFTGEAVPPGLECTSESCPTRVLASYHPGAPERLVVEDALDEAAKSRNDLGGASTFTGFANVQYCTGSPCPNVRFAIGRAPRLLLAWDGPASYRTELPEGQRDFAAFDAVSVRVAVDVDGRNPANVSQDFRIVLQDGAGRRAGALATDHSEATTYPPGTVARKTILNGVRVPLDAFEGVDRRDVREIELAFDATPRGQVWLADLMLQR